MCRVCALQEGGHRKSYFCAKGQVVIQNRICVPAFQVCPWRQEKLNIHTTTTFLNDVAPQVFFLFVFFFKYDPCDLIL